MRKKMGLFVVLLAGMLSACGTSKENAGMPTSNNQLMTQATGVEEPNMPIVPGADITIEPTKAVDEVETANNNMNSSSGKVYADADGTYFWALSKDEHKQILYYIGNEKNDTARAIFDMDAKYSDDSGELTCGYMTGYKDTLVFIESDEQENKYIVHYVTKDGHESGIIGTFSGSFRYAFTAGFKVNDKAYYIVETNDIYEVDIPKKSLSKYDTGIRVTEGNEHLILGVREDGTYYIEYNEEVGIIGVFACDVKTGQTKMVTKLPMDVEHIEMVGDYILYYDGKDEEEGGTSSVYSIHIPTAQKDKLFKIEDFDLYFIDGDFHVSGDMVYYIRSAEDLYSCTIKGENHKLLIKADDDSDRIYELSSSGDWLFYRAGSCMYRMKKDATAYAADPILP